MFSQNHYYSSVTENVTLGTSILKITATDNDEGDNGKIIYSLHQRQQSSQSLLNSKSDTTNQFDSVIDSTPSSAHFAINPRTGWISIIKPLDHESQDLHELVVIAKDQGVQPLQTSAFVSIRVSDINDNQPIVSVIFLTKNSKPMLREDATVGELVARISINDADALASDSSLSSSSSSMKAKKSSSKRFSSYHSFSVSLFGASDGEFGLKTTDQIVYLIVVTAPLDREKISKYHLTVMVSDDGHPPQNTTVSFDLDVIDVNDNPPRFDQTVYHVTLPETIEIGSKVFQMNANDLDSDSILTYAFLVPSNETSIINDDEIIYFDSFNRQNQTHKLTTKTNWFSIDRRSGLITTRSRIDCETESEPKIQVMVCDSLQSIGSFDHHSQRATKNSKTIESSTSFSRSSQNESQINQIGFTAVATLIISISDVSLEIFNFISKLNFFL